ncbi:helix-turn-helix domain-containing protein [Kordia sp.]|uniref:helix-turn-helix domain-containing protein n=1 Tax=Kordia sp. TaxID=1965332 RepID=UPI0025B9C999|nr:helix-turn-helix domain-containing protein [Kordia sp.]MCH2196918.1 helix-turn-helix domain-containing protein [Kordia sp.]
MQNFLNIIILLGTLQGAIMAVLLFRLKIQRQASKLLAWLILLISLACLNIYLLNAVEGTSSFFWNFMEAVFPWVVIMPIGPLVYFYVKSILEPNFVLTKKHRIHFYTVMLDLIPSFVILGYVAGGYLGFINADSTFDLGLFIETYDTYVDIPRWLSLAIYVWFSYQSISDYTKKNTHQVSLRWARHFVLGFMIFAVLWLLHLVLYLIPSSSNLLLGSVGWYPVYIPLIVLLYWLGINGYIISFKTYKKSSKSQEISDATVQQTISKLEQAMKEEKLFLNPSLKLSDVVQQIDIPQKTISFVLNQHIHKSFNEYVNNYRVEAFKSRLLSENDENLTITGIAFECGFNSQATFQRVFKSITNQSPSEFRKAHIKNS